MGCRALAAVLVAGATITVAAPLSARATNDPPAARSPVLTNHPDLQASLARLHAGSAAWRNALVALSATGRRAVVVTPDKVRVRDRAGDGYKPFDRDVLAEVQPLADGEARVHVVIVVVNVALLEEMHAASLRVEFEDDIDRILAHEVYGHAIPYLMAGSLSGKCADPLPGQRATESCAIKRENVIRNELRLGERREYGLDGLAMARRFRY